MDFAEFFTHGAREIAPIAWRRGLLFLFDVRGPAVAVSADLQPMHRTLHRLAVAAIDLLQDGFVFLFAQTELRDDATAELSVSIAGTGVRAAHPPLAPLLRSLGLQERAPPPGGDPGDPGLVAVGRCPDTGATLSFVANRHDGLLFGLDLLAPARRLDSPDLPAPHARGARAWLVATQPLVYQSLVRRLARLGWATACFGSVEQAGAELARLRGERAHPALVIGAASPEVTPAAMEALRPRLRPGTRFVLAAPLDAPVGDAAGLDARVWPFSPRELEDFTREAALRLPDAPLRPDAGDDSARSPSSVATTT